MGSPNTDLASVRSILFDLDGTLRHSRPSSVAAFLDFAVALGVPDSAERRRRVYRWTHYYWAQSADMLQDKEDFPEVNAFWDNYAIRNLLAFDCSPDCALKLAPEVTRRMRTEHQAEDWVPPDVPETLQALGSAGYRLAVLSNRTDPCQEDLENLGLLDYFRFALVAGEVELWKPDPGIFLHAVAQLGTSPHETLYIGDNYYADVVGARAAGLQPVLLDPDGLFPEAGCPVITTLGELTEILNGDLRRHNGNDRHGGHQLERN